MTDMARKDVLDQLEKIFTRIEMDYDYIWRLPDHGVLSYGEYKALETVIQWLREFPEWIYANDTIKNTWLCGEIDKIENALGFRLFYWQKYYMVHQRFRYYGATTAKNLTELITYRDKEPLDFRKKSSTHKECCERHDLLRLKKKLDDAGIQTRKVLLPGEPVSSDNKSKEENINVEPFNYFFAICHDIYKQIKEELPKPPVEDPATKFIRECRDAVVTDQGKMNLIILEELKKRGIHVTEENAVAWSKRIKIVDAGGFGKEYHNFYVYLNKEWEFTIKRTCDANLHCSGYVQKITYAYEVSDELPPEGITL